MSKQQRAQNPDNGHMPVEKYQYYVDEISFHEIWNIFWHGKWLIVAITAIFAVVSISYSLWLPDVYRSEILLSPVEENSVNGSGALLGQLGGLASLAGIDINGDGGASQKIRALATLQSRVFIKNFFDNHELVVPFMASRPTNRSGTVEIDPELYDEVNQVWIREVDPPLQPEPSDWEIYEEFSEILTVEDDTATGLVTVSLEWYDPVQVQQWATWLVQDVNEVMKQREVAEARRAVDYLTEQLARTQLVNMQNVFYNLIEQQTRTVMLADAREEYIFQTLDPAVVAESKSSPNRALICIMGTLLGGLLGLALVFFLHAIKLDKSKASQ